MIFKSLYKSVAKEYTIKKYISHATSSRLFLPNIFRYYDTDLTNVTAGIAFFCWDDGEEPSSTLSDVENP